MNEFILKFVIINTTFILLNPSYIASYICTHLYYVPACACIHVILCDSESVRCELVKSITAAYYRYIFIYIHFISPTNGI